jgi:hypothetical protein
VFHRRQFRQLAFDPDLNEAFLEERADAASELGDREHAAWLGRDGGRCRRCRFRLGRFLERQIEERIHLYAFKRD